MWADTWMTITILFHASNFPSKTLVYFKIGFWPCLILSFSCCTRLHTLNTPQSMIRQPGGHASFLQGINSSSCLFNIGTLNVLHQTTISWPTQRILWLNKTLGEIYLYLQWLKIQKSFKYSLHILVYLAFITDYMSPISVSQLWGIRKQQQ